MRRPAALFPIMLAVTSFTPAQARDVEEGGPIEIEKCQTISQPGAYKLVNNLTFKGPLGGTCLPITADFVTVDLAGFSISGPIREGPPFPNNTATAIAADNRGIVVRNGSISGFSTGVDLGSNPQAGNGSIVEGLRIIGGTVIGIAATGVVKGNTVVDINGGPATGIGISATGIVTGNYAFLNRAVGISVGPGSTVIGNTASGSENVGMLVSCPSNVTDNTVVNNGFNNLLLSGDGCNNTNNVAP